VARETINREENKAVKRAKHGRFRRLPDENDRYSTDTREGGKVWGAETATHIGSGRSEIVIRGRKKGAGGQETDYYLPQRQS